MKSASVRDKRKTLSSSRIVRLRKKPMKNNGHFLAARAIIIVAPYILGDFLRLPGAGAGFSGFAANESGGRHGKRYRNVNRLRWVTDDFRFLDSSYTPREGKCFQVGQSIYDLVLCTHLLRALPSRISRYHFHRLDTHFLIEIDVIEFKRDWSILVRPHRTNRWVPLNVRWNKSGGAQLAV